MPIGALLGVLGVDLGGLTNIIIGGNRPVDPSVKRIIKDTEILIGKSLPRAWQFWRLYKGETEWGNEMFFVWDSRTHWSRASAAVNNLQKYLQDQVNEFEKAQEEKRKEEERKEKERKEKARIALPEPIAKVVSLAQEQVKANWPIFIGLGVVVFVVAMLFFLRKRS